MAVYVKLKRSGQKKISRSLQITFRKNKRKTVNYNFTFEYETIL